MLRSLLIHLSKAAWARNMVTNWSFAWRAASRFVAGETLDDAIQTIRGLNEKGITATLDHLGEHTTDMEKARQSVQDILKAIEQIHLSSVYANVSIKLTQIGLALDEEMCVDNLKQIVTYAKDKGNFIRLDMEDSYWVDTTLRIFRRIREEYGLLNIGVVIQSYLYRSQNDVTRIIQDGGKVRLCKGAYNEPPQVAFPKKMDVDSNYDLLSKIIIDGALQLNSPLRSDNCLVPPIPAFATHDPKRIAYVKDYASKVGIPKQAIEFQMLYGIRRDLQEQITGEGYPVRIYVPYGTEWYPYFMRRLAERPANVWFFISNFFKG